MMIAGPIKTHEAELLEESVDEVGELKEGRGGGSGIWRRYGGWGNELFNLALQPR